MADFLFALIELFFRYLLRFRSYAAKCAHLGCYRSGVDIFALKLYPDTDSPRPSTILGIRKLETLGYPMVKTTSRCLPSF